MTTVHAALDIVEDLLLPALRRLGVAWWTSAPPGAAGDLLRLSSDPEALRRYWVGQHQDNGGQLDPRLNSIGWQGEVVIKCYSADDVAARTGRDDARAAVLALAAPTGYSLRVNELTPPALPCPDEEGIYGRAWRCRVALRRHA